MGKTISTHNGSKAMREHNIRNPKVVVKQEHIDARLSSGNEILLDEHPRLAYKRIFGPALEEYNSRQTRPERRIKDYYNHINADQKKHPVYEMIVQVGDKRNTGINAPVERAIIKEFISGWPERNPNLELIGAYIHADERDGTLHAHLDYIPVAHGYKNGLHTQNGLVKALGEQGFDTEKKEKVTAQIRWEARENRVLENICNAHGIEVEHPEREKEGEKKRKHESTPEYKERKDAINELEAKKIDLESQVNELHLKVIEESEIVEKTRNDISHLEWQKKELQDETDELDVKKHNLENQLDTLHANIIEASKTAESTQNDIEYLVDQIGDLQNATNELEITKYHLEKQVDTLHIKAVESHKAVEAVQCDVKSLEAQRQGLQDETNELEVKKSTLLGQVNTLHEKAIEAHKTLEKVQGDIKYLEGQKRGLLDEVNALQDKKRILTAAEVRALKDTRTLTGGVKGITFKEVQELKRTAAHVDEVDKRNLKMLKAVKVFEQRAIVAEHKADEAAKESPSMIIQAKYLGLQERLGRMQKRLRTLFSMIPEQFEFIRNALERILDDREPFGRSQERGREHEIER